MVLNKSSTLALETRKRVNKVSERQQFCLNTLAKSLRSGLLGSIGLISNDSFGRFTMPIIERLEGVLTPLGIGVFMCNATDDPASKAAHLNNYRPSRLTASSSPPAGQTAAELTN